MILNINSTTIKINKAFIIGNIESNKDVITNFNWTLLIALIFVEIQRN